MIVVKIEVWPLGCENRAKEIGRIEVVNDGTAGDGSGDSRYGNYGVALEHALKRRKRKGVWKTGEVSNHLRSLSPYHLVMRALEACLKKGKK